MSFPRTLRHCHCCDSNPETSDWKAHVLNFVTSFLENFRVWIFYSFFCVCFFCGFFFAVAVGLGLGSELIASFLRPCIPALICKFRFICSRPNHEQTYNPWAFHMNKHQPLTLFKERKKEKTLPVPGLNPQQFHSCLACTTELCHCCPLSH